MIAWLIWGAIKEKDDTGRTVYLMRVVQNHVQLSTIGIEVMNKSGGNEKIKVDSDVWGKKWILKQLKFGFSLVRWT